MKYPYGKLHYLFSFYSADIIIRHRSFCLSDDVLNHQFNSFSPTSATPFPLVDAPHPAGMAAVPGLGGPQYQVRGQIGEGAFGLVFYAVGPKNRVCAIKAFKSNPRDPPVVPAPTIREVCILNNREP